MCAQTYLNICPIILKKKDLLPVNSGEQEARADAMRCFLWRFPPHSLYTFGTSFNTNHHLLTVPTHSN